MIDLNRVSKEALAIAEKRRINGAKISTKTNEMLKHTATEVVEATEAYQYYICEIPYKYEDIELCIEDLQAKNKERFTSELADVIMCILIIAANHDIDIEQALKDTLEKNRKRACGEGDKL